MIAHIRKTDGAKQPLKIHCLQVGLLSKHMAQRLGLSAIAQLIGLLHDMGKATAAFAAYLISAATDPLSAASPHHHAPTAQYLLIDAGFAQPVPIIFSCSRRR